MNTRFFRSFFSFLASFLILVSLTGCKKEDIKRYTNSYPLGQYYHSANEYFTYVELSNITINASTNSVYFECEVIPKDIMLNVRILISDRNPMTNPIIYEMVKKGSGKYQVHISSLSPSTRYYYAIEAYTNVTVAQLQQSSFLTKR